MRRASLVVVLAILVAHALDASAQPRATQEAADVAIVELQETMLAESPTAPAQWSALGTAQYGARRYRESIASFERALQLHSDVAALDAWNIARAYAKLGNEKQALRWLAHAQQFGYRNELAMREEPAFENLRADPRFRALLQPSSCESCGRRMITSLTWM